jgi:hypothetical protein
MMAASFTAVITDIFAENAIHGRIVTAAYL